MRGRTGDEIAGLIPPFFVPYSTLRRKVCIFPLMWPSRRRSEEKSLQNRLGELCEEVAKLGDELDSLRRSQRELDAEMASLWEKVSHALSRLGGRAKKKEPKEEDGEQRELLVSNPLARRLMGRY